MAVPSHGFRETLRLLRPHVGDGTPVVSLTKGLEGRTRKRMTEVVADELPGRPTGVLTGPNLAKEILAGRAAAAVLAMVYTATPLAEELRDVFCAGDFRVYTNTDVVGAEIAGATKNVIALAAGISDGLEAGDNTRAALITRGLAEVTRLGMALGGQPATFAGLAGIGDIVATCVSAQSRNRYVGERLGRGEAIEQIVASMDQVAEGVKSTPVVASLARSRGGGHADHRGGAGGDRGRSSRGRGLPGAARPAAQPAKPAGEGPPRRSESPVAGPRRRRSCWATSTGRWPRWTGGGAVAPVGAGWSVGWAVGAEDRWHVAAEEAAVRPGLIDDMPVTATAHEGARWRRGAAGRRGSGRCRAGRWCWSSATTHRCR